MILETQVEEKIAQKTGTSPANAESPPRIHQELSVEQEKNIDPRRKLFEALRPPKEDADKIFSHIKEATVVEFGEHPPAEIKRILEVASGIFLWQNMLYETGDSLPLGLIFQSNPQLPQRNWYEELGLDENILTRRDYDFALTFFRQYGIWDETAESQRRHRETNKEKIAQGVEELLRHSRVMDYFDSFGIATEKELEVDSATPGSEEWVRKKRELETAFAERHGTSPSSLPDPLWQSAHKRLVEAPLRRMKTPAQENVAQADEQRKTRLREYVHAEYIEKNFMATTRSAQQGVIVRDGEFWFPKDDEGKRTYIKDEWAQRNDNGYRYHGPFREFVESEIRKSGPYLGIFSEYGSYFEAEALRRTIPHLYDVKEKRDFQTIVDDGIHKAAQVLSNSIVKEPFLDLDDIREEYTTDNIHFNDVRFQLCRLIWLTNTRRHHLSDSDVSELQFSLYSWEKLRLESKDISEKDYTGEILFTSPRVFEEAPRRLVYYQNKELLPRIPTQADLCIRLPSTQIDLTNYDPYITGMVLVARSDDRYYFSTDQEQESYTLLEFHINPIKAIEIATFCKYIGMNDLAAAIKDHPDLSIAQLADLARENFIIDLPHEESVLELKHPRELAEKGLIDKSGKLHGQNAIFEYFFRSILKMGLDSSNSFQFARGVSGSLLTENGIQEGIYAQTSIYMRYGHLRCMIDPLIPSRNEQSNTSEKQITVQKEADYSEAPATIYLPAREEIEKQKKTKIAEVKFLNPEVFNGTEQRLIQQRPRNKDVPKTSQQFDLSLEIQNDLLASEDQDPYIPGMLLTARDGKLCYFQLDPGSSIAIPAENELPKSTRNQIYEILWDLGIERLNDDLRGPLTVVSLVESVRKNIKEYHPQEKQEIYLRNIYYLLKKELIDEQGMLRGESEVFNYFLKSLLTRVYGKQAVGEETGFALTKNKRDIDATIQKQVHLKVPAIQGFPREAIDCLLSTTPVVESLQSSSEVYEPMHVYRHISRNGTRQLRPGQLIANDQDRSDSSDTKGDSTLLSYNEHNSNGNLHIPDAKEWEKKKSIHVGEILFASEEVFAGIQQRLIQQRPRDENMHVITDENDKRAVIENQADMAIQITDSSLVDEKHDIAVLGMRLVARDEQHKIYFFQLDKEHNPYARLEEKIPADKQQAEARICEEMGMQELAREIREAKGLTVASLLDLDRKYVKGWVPREGSRQFSINNRMGFRQEGLIRDGILRGVCDSFKFFVDEQMGGIFGEQYIDDEVGISISGRRIINSMKHGQTRLRIPSKGIDSILDIEPDPEKAEIEGSTDSDSRVLEVSDLSETNDEGDYFSGNIEELLSDLGLEPFVTETDEDDEEAMLNGNSQSSLIEKKKPKYEPSQAVVTKSEIATSEEDQEKKEPEESSVSEAFVLPSPEENLDKFKLRTYQNGEDIILKGNDARQFLEEKQTKENMSEQLRTELESSCTLYERYLLTYLGAPVDNLSFEVVQKRVHNAIAPLLHGKAGAWKNIPHVLIYSMVREYTKWNAKDWTTRGKFTTFDEAAIAKAKELMQAYQDHPGEKNSNKNGQHLPQYDPRFLQLMERVVNLFSSVQERGGTY